jgi:hypothetical protein
MKWNGCGNKRSCQPTSGPTIQPKTFEVSNRSVSHYIYGLVTLTLTVLQCWNFSQGLLHQYHKQQDSNPVNRERSTTVRSHANSWAGTLFHCTMDLWVFTEARTRLICGKARAWSASEEFLFFVFVWIPFYLQSLQIHSANGVKLLEAWRGVPSNTPPYQ